MLDFGSCQAGWTHEFDGGTTPWSPPRRSTSPSREGSSGTVNYMAPEQAEGNETDGRDGTSSRSGSCCTRWPTGTLPFQGGDRHVAMISQHPEGIHRRRDADSGRGASSRTRTDHRIAVSRRIRIVDGRPALDVRNELQILRADLASRSATRARGEPSPRRPRRARPGRPLVWMGRDAALRCRIPWARAVRPCRVSQRRRGADAEKETAIARGPQRPPPKPWPREKAASEKVASMLAR